MHRRSRAGLGSKPADMSRRDIMICRNGLVDERRPASPGAIGQGQICLRVFNTENTKDSRSSTEQDNIALLASRIELLDAVNVATKLLYPGNLRGNAVDLRVLRVENRLEKQ